MMFPKSGIAMPEIALGFPQEEYFCPKIHEAVAYSAIATFAALGAMRPTY